MTTTIHHAPDGTTYEERCEYGIRLPAEGTTCLEVGGYGSSLGGHQEVIWPQELVRRRLISSPCDLVFRASPDAEAVRMVWVPYSTVLIRSPCATVFTLLSEPRAHEGRQLATTHIGAGAEERESEDVTTVLGRFFLGPIEAGEEDADENLIDLSRISLAGSRPTYKLRGPRNSAELPRLRFTIPSDLFGEDD